MALLPPLNGLRAFEAAARHLSFKVAAEELHVTPAAVSQQIRALEDFVGHPLFHRRTRSLQLTETGATAAPLLKDGFDLLAEAAERMRQEADSGIITVSVAPSFGAKWLVPRLDRFRAAYPDHDIRIDATDTLANFTTDGVDLALRYGRGIYRNLEAECLMSDSFYPVCSPKLLEGDKPLARPEDLCHHALIHVHWRMENETVPNWRMWLRAAGVEGVDPNKGLRFGVESMAVQAAIEGHGVALSGRALVEDDLKSGRLVRPFPASVIEATDFSYYLVYPENRLETPKCRAFRDWVFAEIERGREEAA